MSVPNTMAAGPWTTTILVKKRYLFFYIFLFWISLIPPLLEFWLYWQLLWKYSRPIHFFIYLPLWFFLMYLTLVFSALLFAKLLLLIVNAIHTPKEGVFLRDPSDKDYRYWNIRNVIKRWPIWVSHKFPFPFLDNLCFKMFGVKTSLTNSLFEGWVDTEFIEFGNNVVVGQGSVVLSSMIVGNLLIIKKIIVEDNVRIGSHTVISPGTHIKKNTVLASNSTTIVGQELEEGYIYVGVPAHKFKENRFFEEGLENLIGKVFEDEEKIHAKYEEVYEKQYFEHLTSKERRQIKKELREKERLRLEKATDSKK